MEFLYDQVIELVTRCAEHTPAESMSRIAPIVNKWRLKYEHDPGKHRQLPLRTGSPKTLSVFLNRAVAAGLTDLTLYVSTEDFFVDPDLS